MTQSRTHLPWRRILFFIFSLLVTLVVFRTLFTKVSWTDVFTMIQEIDFRWVGVFLLFSFFQLVLRTIRYGMVLRASGEAPPKLALFLVVVVRGLCVDMLPARAGELVYIFLVRTRLGIDLGAATASFALAFLFDVVALGPLVILGAWAMGSEQGFSTPALVGGGIFLLVVSIALIAAMVPVLKWGSRLFHPWADKGKKWAVFICSTADSICESLRLAKEKNLFWKLLSSSLLIRVCKYSSLYALILALLAPLGFTMASAPPAKSFIALVSGELAASLPISGLGGFGAYEGTMTFVLVLLGFAEDTATALTIAHRGLTQLYGLLLGLSALLLLMLPVFRRGDDDGPGENVDVSDPDA
ncbi:lysylphosphatidylglycerol synthase transmembrane domain-containing protein [Kiritimatiellaeota bacterium B1221]|nr:lysylphosphatidylglycerol synthase transmembrane domain-containing protein [Kiritimatiellaeota bacterium B1221]